MGAEYTDGFGLAPGRSAILPRMIKSMTGFARHQATGTWGQLVWELRTVNHRYLDVSFRLPEPMRALCPNLTEHTIGSGHWMAQEKPVEVNAAIVRWLVRAVPGVWPD
mgnify:CR=1 FL=1